MNDMIPPSDAQQPYAKGIISYFAENSVAANLLMVFIIIMGIVSFFTLPRQLFPNIELNYIEVQVNYPGASPQEIEEGIVEKIEESLKDITEIDKIWGRSFRNGGRVTLEIDPDERITDVLNKVKSRIDSIATFPAAMEPPTISQIEFEQDVIEMAIVGDRPLSELTAYARQVEDELLQLQSVQIARQQSPPEEIAIEVLPNVLRTYGLTVQDISAAINRYSQNLSAGQVQTTSGVISVRVENQYYQGDEFRNIPVIVGANGAVVTLQDIATINDGFVEGERYFKFNGRNAIMIEVAATKSQDIIPIAETVNKYISNKNDSLPDDLEIRVLVDTTYYLKGRLNMMLSNLSQGAVLVFLMLALFLRVKLAFWVMVGLPVCFLGAMMLMPTLSLSINILSLFAFIMVLGIVVDDAIVIGESAYSQIEKEGHSLSSVIRGTQKVATPATFGVLTTMAVFAPFAMSSGPQGDFFINISAVVIFCLAFSLIESKLILPAHLANTSFSPIKAGSWRARFNKHYAAFIDLRYLPFLRYCTRHRWSVFATFTALLLISFGLIQANYVRIVPDPKVPHDFPRVRIEMNENAADTAVVNALKQIEQVIMDIEHDIKANHNGQGMVRDILVFNNGRTSGTVLAPLVDEDLRVMDTFELARRWRQAIPEIPGMKSFQVIDDVNGDRDDGELGYMLFGADLATLNAAGRSFIEQLNTVDGVFDVSSTIDPPSKEVRMVLKPVAHDLGLDLALIAQQVGASFYGGEAQRVLRDGEEIKVMVRYPRLTRETFAELKYTHILTPSGDRVLLGDVVQLREEPGISYIRREEGFRSVYIWGQIDEEMVEPSEVLSDIQDRILPELKLQFPGVKTELGGAIEEQQAQMNEQALFFVAGLVLVYILLAVPLKSYGQPVIIMSVIPFSLTGAIWGHFLLGLDLSMFSTFGLIAAAGVVVNDSLVMTHFINELRQQGVEIKEAVIQAGQQRFRAITLTSITTFAGVLPIMFETSLQAAFVIPMAVSLGFAVLYATLVTLILVPCFYLMLLDVSALATYPRLWLAKRLS